MLVRGVTYYFDTFPSPTGCFELFDRLFYAAVSVLLYFGRIMIMPSKISDEHSLHGHRNEKEGETGRTTVKRMKSPGVVRESIYSM